MNDKNDTLALLGLAADIARAGRDPGLWPLVLGRIGDGLECAAVFGEEQRMRIGKGTAPTVLIANAQRCALEQAGPCGCVPAADENKRRICLALVEHLMLAASPQTALPGLHGYIGELPRPIYLVASDARLLDANTEGRRLLAERSWVGIEGDTFRMISGAAQKVLLRSIVRLQESNGQEKVCQKLSNHSGQRAELWIRRLAREEGVPARFLLSLIVHETPQIAGEGAAMSPRQREIAGYLHAGKTLTEAAALMGITRRTAKDHLAVLFRISHTRRQAELVAWLTRQHLI